MEHRTRRFTDSVASKMFGAALSLGSLDACAESKEKLNDMDAVMDAHEILQAAQAQERPVDRQEGIEQFVDTDIMKKEWFETLPHIEYAALRPHLSSAFAGCSDREVTAKLKHLMMDVTEQTDSKLKKMRFPTEEMEDKYFSRLMEEKTKQEILQAITDASDITGVPENLLLAIGCIESQWNAQAENASTAVYGPMQMKFETAKQIAAQMNIVYALQISIEKPEDLKQIRDSVMLAAGHLQRLYQKYGQWNLAAAAYASGGAVLEEKIHTIFPEINLGHDATRKREKHSENMKAASEQIRFIKEKRKQTKQDAALLKQLRQAWLEHNDEYKKYRNEERDCLERLPDELAKHGVSVYTLFSKDVCAPDGTSCGFSKHSLEYAIAIDDMAMRARYYMGK